MGKSFIISDTDRAALSGAYGGGSAWNTRLRLSDDYSDDELDIAAASWDPVTNKVKPNNSHIGTTEPSPSNQAEEISNGTAANSQESSWAQFSRGDTARAESSPPVEPTPTNPADPIPISTKWVLDPDPNNPGSWGGTMRSTNPSGISGITLPDPSSAFSSLSDGVGSLVDSGKSIINEGINIDFPGVGNFGIPSLAGKAEEMVGGLFSAGKDVIGKFTGLFSGDKSGTLNSVKEKLMPSLHNDLSKLDYDNKSDPSTLFVTLRSHQNPSEFVRFNVTPVIGESREATYEEVAIVHHPGQILRYKSSSTRSWSLNTKLISRNPEEASKNLKTLNLIRGWVMPYYGYGTAETDPNRLGAPPDILLFSAYGAKMIPEHPTVLVSYNTSYPNDIDYIQTDSSFGDVVPFPVILNIDLTLKEAWSPIEYSSFDLKSYKRGDLKAAFSGKINIPGSSTAKAGGVAGAPGSEDPEVRRLNAGKNGSGMADPIEDTEARGFNTSKANGAKLNTSEPIEDTEARGFNSSRATNNIVDTEARNFAPTNDVNVDNPETRNFRPAIDGVSSGASSSIPATDRTSYSDNIENSFKMVIPGYSGSDTSFDP